MINALYNLGLNALRNAQVSLTNTSNNIANADTEGYQRTETNYETSSSITIRGLMVGTGAEVDSITSQWDKFVEAQYLDASADLSRENAALEYLSQLDTLFYQDEDEGLAVSLDEFWASWSELAADPTSTSAREALLGDATTLAYALNTLSEELDGTVESINSEIVSEVGEANDLIDQIAAANQYIAANQDDNQAISDRAQLVRELNALIGVNVIEQSNGQITILTEEGYNLVDGNTTHHLAYAEAGTTESLTRGSTYDGEIQYSGDSSEELLLQFVSSGPDGSAQFKVSLDGGETWLTGDDGNTLLYTADGATNSVTIEGVEISFSGVGDHAEGDRYTIMPKSGLYWEKGDGSLVNITPLTDESGVNVDGRTSGGSLAGLFLARDDVVVPARDELDDLSRSLIWEVNSLHSQGAGLEAQDSLTGAYSVEDQTAALSNCGLTFGDAIQAGTLELVIYDADGAVSTTADISVAPSESLDDLVADINAACGGELTASVDGDGRLVLSAATGQSFEVAGDSSSVLAALGLNTFFNGNDAGDIAVCSSIAGDLAHINAGAVGDDGLVASGGNDVASSIARLAEQEVAIGTGRSSSESTYSEFLGGLVSFIGSAAASAESKGSYAEVSAQYYSDQQASASEVNVDEELVNLTKYQQSYQAAAKMIEVTRSLMDTLLDMV